MIETNLDIVWEIARQIQFPNPVLYTRLAMVNKDFHTVFTSDRLWAALDVYQIRQGIFDHFLNSIRNFEGLLAVIWETHDSNLDINTIDNKYMQLSMYLKTYSLPPSDDEWFVEKVLDIAPDIFSASDPSIQGDRDLLLRHYRKHPASVCSLPRSLQLDTDLCKELINIYTQQGFQTRHPYSLIEPENMSRELREYACELYFPSMFDNPLLQCLSPKFRAEILDKVLLNPKSAVLMFQGQPKYLDWCPHFWKYPEVCISALRGTGYVPDLGFLAENRNVDVMMAAISESSSYLISCPTFANNKSIVIACLSNVKNGDDIYNITAIIDKTLWDDPEVVQVAADNGIFQHFSAFNIPLTETLKTLCDDYDWIKQRIKSNPSMWNKASSRVKQNKDLLLMAFHYGNIIFLSPVPSLTTILQLESIPESLHSDPEVIKAAADYGVLHLIPDKNLSRECIKEYIIHHGFGCYPQYSNDFEIVFEAVKKCPEYLTDASPELKRHPKILSTFKGHLYRLQGLWSDSEIRAGIENMYGAIPEWENIGIDSVYDLDPSQYGMIPKSFFTVDTAVEAVKRNGLYFSVLRDELKYNERVQKAIGPLKRN